MAFWDMPSTRMAISLGKLGGRSRPGTQATPGGRVDLPTPMQSLLARTVPNSPEAMINAASHASPQAQPIPTSWAMGEGMQQGPPLFSPQQVEAMNRAQQGHPLPRRLLVQAPPLATSRRR